MDHTGLPLQTTPYLNGRHLIPARYSFIDPGRMAHKQGVAKEDISGLNKNCTL